MTTKTPAGTEIRLTVPPRIHAKLASLMGYRSLEDWVRDLIVRAAEDIEPSLARSGLWRMDVATWADPEWEDDDD